MAGVVRDRLKASRGRSRETDGRISYASARSVGSLNQRGRNVGSQKWIATGYIWKMGLLGFAHRLNEGGKRVNSDSKSFQWSN